MDSEGDRGGIFAWETEEKLRKYVSAAGNMPEIGTRGRE